MVNGDWFEYLDGFLVASDFVLLRSCFGVWSLLLISLPNLFAETGLPRRVVGFR